jgi:hypothetical protein
MCESGIAGTRGTVWEQPSGQTELEKWKLDGAGRFIREIGEVAVGDPLELGANDVRREARGEEAAIERGELALVELAAKVREPALEAGPDERGFVGLGEDGVERSFDVAIRDTTGAEVTSDPVASLTAQAGVVTSVLESVARVIEIIQLTETGNHRGNQVFVFGAAVEVLLHLVNRVRAAHQGALRGHVELVFGGEFAGV